jgi:hypothetical protein
VKAVTRDVVLEQVAVTGNPPIEWAHTGGPYVVNLGVSVFSPYLSAFGRVGPETRLGIRGESRSLHLPDRVDLQGAGNDYRP